MKTPAGTQDVGAQLLTRFLRLHPYTALLAIALDWGLFGSNLMGPGLGLILGLILALPLAWAVSRMQRALHQEEPRTSRFKGIAVAVLVCIPTPIFSAPVFLSGLLGILGSRGPSRQER